MISKNAKIYIAGHRGMVGSACWRILQEAGYTNLIGKTSKELDLKNQQATDDFIKTEKPDSSEKYGRILGWLYVDGDTVSVNDHMIEDGYAWGYLGETKVKDFEALKKQRAKSGK